jgi:adenylate cyclase
LILREKFFDFFNKNKQESLGGKCADISVLFVDIRNFTSIADSLEPEAVGAFLNEYFAEMVPIIHKYKGNVNKFIGDEIMVIFGAPIETTNHAAQAVKCAVEIFDKVKNLQKKWQNKNRPIFDIGIGISTGVAFVGNIGTKEIFEYSAVGHTVNTAHRLETFNKIYKTTILISENTYNSVQGIIEAEEVDSVCIAKKSEPIKIYELKSIKQ